MLIERVWAANRGRNFHYLIACPETREALAVDPLNAEACLARGARTGLAHHPDLQHPRTPGPHRRQRRDGGGDRRAGTGAQGGSRADRRCHAWPWRWRPGARRPLGATHCLDTPGHTRAHLCLYGEAAGDAAPALFSGDTLFNAGAGNCLHGGDPLLLYDTFSGSLSQLPTATRVFPGHEYLLRNLDFTLDREPSNAAARDMMRRCRDLAAEAMPVTTLAQEHQFNVFFRLDNPEVIAELRQVRSDWHSDPGAREVFLALRELRNRW